jgi:cupin 2 domain-containing protein
MMNLYSYTPPKEGKEFISTLLQNEAVRIERIISNTASTQWMDREEAEWVVLLKGSSVIEFEDETLTLAAGDTLHIGAHRRHRVVSTSEDALWLAVFYPSEQMC